MVFRHSISKVMSPSQVYHRGSILVHYFIRAFHNIVIARITYHLLYVHDLKLFADVKAEGVYCTLRNDVTNVYNGSSQYMQSAVHTVIMVLAC